MALRTKGSSCVQNSQNRKRPRVLPITEMAASVPDPTGGVDAAKAALLEQVQRQPNGTLADAASASLLGQLGGRAKADRDRGLRVLEGLGLRGAAPEFLAAYLGDAETFAISEVSRLALEAGRGVCGPMPSSMVQSAALELAGSRAAFAMGDVLTGSKLAGASRANLLCAFDLCCKQAHERPKSPNERPIWLQLAESSAAKAASQTSSSSNDAAPLPDAPVGNVVPPRGNQ